MALAKLFGDARRLGPGSALSILWGNLRMYGWRATLRKLARRFVSVDSVYRHHSGGLQRLGIDRAGAAPGVFGAPCLLVVGALDLPQCKKYRVLQKVEYAARAGWSAYYASYLDEARVLSYLQVATALVLYRVPDSPQLDQLLAEARRLGVDVLYDIDDPIFDEVVYRQNRNLEHIAAHERDAILASAPLYRDAMGKADALLMSTQGMAQLARKHFDTPVYVWRNLLDAATLSCIEHVTGPAPVAGEEVVIAYTSGSRAHEADFRVVADALLQVMHERPTSRLRVIGYAELPEAFAAVADRVEQRPFSSYQHYLQALAGSDLCIVPLLDDGFNACKSAIRFLEASACEVPSIASPVGQFAEVIEQGSDGYLARTEAQWTDSMLALIDSADRRRAVAAAAHAKVMAEHRVGAEGAVDAALLERLVS